VVSNFLNLGLLAAAISGASSVVIVLSQRWHGKHTLDHDLDGVQKFHETAVPRIGGLAIFAAFVTTLLAGNLKDSFSESNLETGWLLLAAALPAFGSGLIEDLTKKVSVRSRLLGALLSALAASWLLGATVDELDIWGVDRLLEWAPFALVVTAVVVAGGVNAINIIDGFNGLASAAVIVMLAAFGILAWHVGDALVAQLAFLGLGAVLGFFCVNYPTGRLFLGDGGAYLLGFWVAEIAVLLLVRNPSVNAWQVLSICAYPVIEVLYSMYRRKVVRQLSPGAPDGLHLHTLIFRRALARFFVSTRARPWTRNAAVTAVIIPWVALAAFLGVSEGTTLGGAIALVLCQLVAYLGVYARLVRGYWGFRFGRKPAPVSPLNVEPSIPAVSLRSSSVAGFSQGRDDEFASQQQLSEQI
jgi:UDP-N-acetylmuramyl pentapeptide phosphotransferase/UDP-N-acetylglucosamine-1-phosphate transferase